MSLNEQANFPINLDLSRSLHCSPSPDLDDAEYGIAGVTWPASACLVEYLLDSKEWQFDPDPASILQCEKAGMEEKRTIIDLGSGTGHLPKSLMPLLGEGKADQIVATDLDEVVPLLRKNLESSSSVQSEVALEAT
ncbi:hypothetical protein BT69DRAFT_1349853 [Atractiella rhizophila]|nr:hypothetical protein BT69DRAFT_1349853 [Atractiella rhizophila]